MQNFVVSPEFKTKVTDVLNTKKFTVVFPFMNLINREGNLYNESELNQLVQFLGELPYNEVSELFNLIPVLVQKVEEPTQPEAEAPAQPEAETVKLSKTSK